MDTAKLIEKIREAKRMESEVWIKYPDEKGAEFFIVRPDRHIFDELLTSSDLTWGDIAEKKLTPEKERFFRKLYVTVLKDWRGLSERLTAQLSGVQNLDSYSDDPVPFVPEIVSLLEKENDAFFFKVIETAFQKANAQSAASAIEKKT